jgi:methionyl-tRNA formyltransferase
MVEALDAAEAGRLELTEQTEDGVTYAEKIDPAERQIDPGRPAAEVDRVVRALTPAIGAYLEAADGERLGVVKARVDGDSSGAGELSVDDGRLLLGCADRALELVEVKPSGKRAMTAPEYLRGRRPPSRAVPPRTRHAED